MYIRRWFGKIHSQDFHNWNHNEGYAKWQWQKNPAAYWYRFVTPLRKQPPASEILVNMTFLGQTDHAQL